VGLASKKQNQGFTLIEVLVALAIFTIIGIATVRQIQQISTTKKVALAQLDQYNAARTTVAILRHDLSQTFHIRYQDLGEEAQNAIRRNAQVPHTIFDGRKNEMVFTSLSHRVYYAGRKECEQTELSYFLESMEGEKAFSLMKRESEIIDGDLYQGGPVFRLLDYVQSMELEYWDPKKQKWVSDWSSDGPEYRDRFPLAVKMKMIVLNEDRAPIVINTEFKLAFPNNEEFITKFE